MTHSYLLPHILVIILGKLFIFFCWVWTHIGILYTYAETSHKNSVMMDLIKLIPFNDHSNTYQNSPGCLGGSPEFMSERSGYQHGALRIIHILMQLNNLIAIRVSCFSFLRGDMCVSLATRSHLETSRWAHDQGFLCDVAGMYAAHHVHRMHRQPTADPLCDCQPQHPPLSHWRLDIRR